MIILFAAKYVQRRCRSNKITIELLHQKLFHDLLVLIVPLSGSRFYFDKDLLIK